MTELRVCTDKIVNDVITKILGGDVSVESLNSKLLLNGAREFMVHPGVGPWRMSVIRGLAGQRWSVIELNRKESLLDVVDAIASFGSMTPMFDDYHSKKKEVSLFDVKRMTKSIRDCVLDHNNISDCYIPNWSKLYRLRPALETLLGQELVVGVGPCT